MNEWQALREAVEIGARSPCAKSKRGVVVWAPHLGVTAWGHNTPPRGFGCDGSDACRAACGKVCVHAEQAAILSGLLAQNHVAQMEMLHVKVVDGEGVPGGPPSCPDCSKLILAVGIAGMWLYEEREGGPQLVRYTAEEFHRTTLANCGLPQGKRGQPG